MNNTQAVSVATDASSHSINQPQCVSVGLVWSVPVVRAGYQIAQATGQAPLKHSGVFSFPGLTLEGCSCVLCLDLGPSESGKMKSEPQARRSSQRGLDPGTGGCVSQPIRVPLDRKCSVSHAVTDAVRGLTSISGLGWASYARNPATRINNHDTL